MEKKCRYCRARLPEDASFCPHCAKSQLMPASLSIPLPQKKKSRLPLILAAFSGAAVLLAGGLLLLHRIPEPGAEPTVLEASTEAAVPEEEAPEPSASEIYGPANRVDLVSVHGEKGALTTYYNEYTSGGSFFITYSEYYPNGNTAYSLVYSVTDGYAYVRTFGEDGTPLTGERISDYRAELEAREAITTPEEAQSEK